MVRETAPIPETAPAPNEMEQIVQAARDALTDSMVERLTVTAANAMEIVDRLNEEATRDAIHTAIDRLTELHRVGALDTLFDLVTILHAARSASTDPIIERLSAFVEQMVNTLGSDNLARLAEGATGAMEDAVRETADATPSGGLFSTISLISKPESQKSLIFLLSLGKHLQSRCCH
jgi:uncharacterized protein YjgD (DUF1641 family)